LFTGLQSIFAVPAQPETPVLQGFLAPRRLRSQARTGGRRSARLLESPQAIESIDETAGSWNCGTPSRYASERRFPGFWRGVRSASRQA